MGEPRRSGCRACALSCSALLPGVHSSVGGIALHCAALLRRRYFLVVIGILGAWLGLLVYFNLMNAIISADRRSWFYLGHRIVKGPLSLLCLSYFVLCFVYHYKLPYILLDVGNDEWIEMHFKRRLRVLSSLEPGSRQPWVWEKPLVQLGLARLGFPFLYSPRHGPCPVAFTHGSRWSWWERKEAGFSLKPQLWLLQSTGQLAGWTQTNSCYSDHHLPGVQVFSTFICKMRIKHRAYPLEWCAVNRTMFPYTDHSPAGYIETLWKLQLLLFSYFSLIRTNRKTTGLGWYLAVHLIQSNAWWAPLWYTDPSHLGSPNGYGPLETKQNK